MPVEQLERIVDHTDVACGNVYYRLKVMKLGVEECRDIELRFEPLGQIFLNESNLRGIQGSLDKEFDLFRWTNFVLPYVSDLFDDGAKGKLDNHTVDFDLEWREI